MKKLIIVILIAFILIAWGRSTNTLVAYWNFDSIENGIVKDLSGNNFNAVSHGATLTDGKKGKAFNGNGKGYFEVKYVPSLDNFKQGITIAAWVYRDTSSSWNCIITREVRDTWSEYFDLGVAQNIPLFSVDSDGNHFTKTEYKQTLPTGKWIHLAGTFDNKTYILYIDGKEVYSGIKELSFMFSDQNPWIIGSNTNDQGKTYHDFFFGKIDELKIFNKALSPKKISDLAN